MHACMQKHRVAMHGLPHSACSVGNAAHPACLRREPAIFGAVAPTGGRDPIFEAIKKTFNVLDEEIIHVAEHSNVPDCQFGGTTALMALIIGQARLFWRSLPPQRVGWPLSTTPKAVSRTPTKMLLAWRCNEHLHAEAARWCTWCARC